ncbi:MAG: LLM class flavin-dependent oxidoreductase [Pseudomonadales bacterium]|nr:LLM class flavin-dependent oxidoreductase [Pseudomonadales bacterium]MCP5185008.1 LLM class flavin-dependent oxidoreductase [Pseudomonadales bacterium]
MSHDVRFGLWYDFRNPAPARWAFEDLYAEYLKQIAWAESLGFQSVWLTEHHFVEDGYTPSPLVLAAAIGERTRSMRIGTNLMLLPLADPVRLAEDAAALSILTRGRFDLGVGLGYRELEFNYFKRSLRHRPSLMEEGVEILRQAWSGNPVTLHGKRFQLDNLPVRPVPATRPGILMGGMAEPAIARAARLGDGFLSTGGIGHDLYIQALAAQGKPRSAGAIYAGHWGIISPDPEAEARRVAPYALYQTNAYVAWGAFGPPDQVPLFPDGDTALREGLYDVWDGDTAVRELVTLLRTYPEIRDVHFWAQLPGEPLEQGSARIEYMATQVLPKVRATLAATP